MNLNKNYINQLLEYEKVENGLYIVPTPIGNLGDITIRSIKILLCADLILCEDTRNSKKLTSKYGIKTPLKPYHKFNAKRVIPGLVKKLHDGNKIALISDAGTPAISDPGSDLIYNCYENNIKIFSLPGPSAPIASLVLSTFAENCFSFRGFFPRQKKYMMKEIHLLKNSDCPSIFFESPKRILKTLQSIREYYKNCNVTLVRELTKKNEEVVNAKIDDLIILLQTRQKILGEITFIVEPSTNDQKKNITSKEILQLAYGLSKEGLNTLEISKIISADLNIPKRKIYQLIIKNKN